MTQKAARMGRSKIRQKKTQVLKPPPSFQETYRGTSVRSEIRSGLEKESAPLVSAGTGALAMLGDCWQALAI